MMTEPFRVYVWCSVLTDIIITQTSPCKNVTGLQMNYPVRVIVPLVGPATEVTLNGDTGHLTRVRHFYGGVWNFGPPHLTSYIST